MSERQAALVTGGAIRVGLHFAKTLAAKGYDIAIHYNSSADKAEEAAVAIRAMGVNCAIFPCDFLSGRDPSGLIDDVAAVFPHLSVLVNCASIYNAAPVAETTMAVLQNEFMVNFFTPFLLSGAFARRVERGNIVNILDNKIAFQQYQYGAYLSAKKALGELTKMTAMEFAPRIRVNGIAPGVIMPGVTRTDDYIDWRVKGIPLQRQGAVEELGKALLYILDNEYITGQHLFVDGGEGLFHIGQNAEVYQP
ncbi:MAG: short-chain dehydrogenase [Gammaproteobacteria bacterium BRH_c0]|nr:MAG: short-chain dehydrogenase [Gammaproteobacteria bacterium BRH_c0]